MDINEFSIACKMITMKLKGFEIPQALPPSLLASATSVSQMMPPSSLNIMGMQQQPGTNLNLGLGMSFSRNPGGSLCFQNQSLFFV